jgi:hypothetical protein
MNPYQKEFRSQTFSSIFTVLSKTFKEIMMGGSLCMVFIVLALLPLIGILTTIDWSPFMQMDDIQDSEELAFLMMQSFTDIFANFGVKEALLFLLSGVSLMLIGAWYTAFNMLAVEMYIKGHKWSFSELVQRSLSNSVIWVFMFQLFLILLYIIVVSLSAIAGGVLQPSMTFLILIGYGLLIMKFIQAQPAIVHGNMSVGQAISYSNSKVGVGQTFKYVGISFLGFISIFMGMMMVMVAGGLLGMIPVLGVFLSLTLNLIFNFLILALVNITQSVLYFKYAEDLKSDSSMAIEDHLI